MSRGNELDGFQLLSGVVSVCAGPIMLAMGAPAGWAFLIMGAGTVVLLALWAIAANITFASPDAATITRAGVGLVCIAIAVVYFTRAANDLPTIFPGYDVDSENFQLLPGFLTLIVGTVLVARAVASVQPRRPSSPESSAYPHE